MGKFYFEKNNKRIFIKDVDYAEGELTFTENEREAYRRSGDYYTRAERDGIIYHFSEKYPEIKSLKYNYD